MSRLVTSLMVLVAALAVARPANAGEIFGARLTGADEVPPKDTPMNGLVIIELSDDGTSARFQLTVRSGVRVQQAHIHCGQPGVNGTIVVFLAGNHSPGWEVDGEWVSNTSFTDDNVVDRTTTCGTNFSAIVQAIRDGATYANVHTVANPAGEIRGQLAPLF